MIMPCMDSIDRDCVYIYCLDTVRVISDYLPGVINIILMKCELHEIINMISNNCVYDKV